MITFPKVTNRIERKYIHAYWRYLLGWGSLPAPPKLIARPRRIELRKLAHHAIKVKPKRKGKLITFPNLGMQETKHE